MAAMFALAMTIAASGVAAPAQSDPGQQFLIAELLQSHNLERRRTATAPLAWDPALAAGAQAYADQLARTNVLRHSPKAGRRGVGENLWLGTRGYFRPAAMVGSWRSERAMFRPARFPDVSVTGNWADVGHYTQMIWPATQRVGCAIGTSARFDILVCRYWPSGNVSGHKVG